MVEFIVLELGAVACVHLSPGVTKAEAGASLPGQHGEDFLLKKHSWASRLFVVTQFASW